MNTAQKYYLPEPSYWPIIGTLALMVMCIGGVMAMNEIDHGGTVLLARKISWLKPKIKAPTVAIWLNSVNCKA